jgi:hypothetical protein
MRADRQDRQAHYLFSPDLVPLPLLFPPVTHSGIPMEVLSTTLLYFDRNEHILAFAFTHREMSDPPATVRL